jgi:hypothetical protein
MFGSFINLIIKLILFHKNNSLVIESCQFRDGRCYVIKIWKENKYETNRRVNLKMREIGAPKELDLKSAELWRKFNPIMNILKRTKDNIVQKVFDLKQC